MLRVGLTGGLGSGKSTVGRFFAEFGAAVIDADEVGRGLMQPGQAVYDEIVSSFGPAVVRVDGSLDRRALAELAFAGGRVGELNRIVHPPVIAAQEEWMHGVYAGDPEAVAIVESALVFEASGGISGEGHAASVPGWRERFDRIILVAAPDELKIERFIARSTGDVDGDTGGNVAGDRATVAEDARRRLRAQIPDAEKVPLCDWVIDNSGHVEATRTAVAAIYAELRGLSKESGARNASRSL